eukprot:TRINITY_DN13381_c0_g1_i1.p1 TRINITY_DN13381_c0_g1~~TRINITY_DN13381_c0_g1_i1.p1  ORF type:complete len:286 (-),score=35.39 TRINITY_DN13381_c0_g1_i1:122-922(-)
MGCALMAPLVPASCVVLINGPHSGCILAALLAASPQSQGRTCNSIGDVSEALVRFGTTKGGPQGLLIMAIPEAILAPRAAAMIPAALLVLPMFQISELFRDSKTETAEAMSTLAEYAVLLSRTEDKEDVVDTITPREIDNLIAQRCTTGKAMGAARSLRRFLSGAWNFAQEDQEVLLAPRHVPDLVVSPKTPQESAQTILRHLGERKQRGVTRPVDIPPLCEDCLAQQRTATQFPFCDTCLPVLLRTLRGSAPAPTNKRSVVYTVS